LKAKCFKGEIWKKYFYEIHIFLGREEGYSCFFESEKYMEDESEIIKKAVKIIPEIKEDIDICDYAQEVSKEEYNQAMGKDTENG
jgi:hypothetical protein